MKLIDLIRLVRRHIVMLIVVPLIMATMVILVTMKPHFKYASATTLYTGIATGSSVEMDKSFNFFATTTAFDNLINIIKSRETQQEVAIRLLSQHLMMEGPDPKYISARSFEELKKITPAYIQELVVRMPETGFQGYDSLVSGIQDDTLQVSCPPFLNREAYEQTVRNLTYLMQSNDTNFVYKLLNYPNPHYSFKEISAIKVERVASSDLVKLYYETDDPGICQQTLQLMNEICIRNFRDIKENRSDAVVKYFEGQLAQAAARLKVAEDKLLEFNKDNNIINYYEQSKAVAVVKEDLEVEYNDKNIELAGTEAAIKRLEEKLDLQEQIQLKSGSIVDRKNELGEINYRIAMAETMAENDSLARRNLYELRAQADKLKTGIRDAVSEFYTYGNSIDGLPVNTILNEWIDNVIKAENLKAGMEVLSERIAEFQKQYAVYAPAGANIKRIEREISVSEQEYLEILHGLNLAKLKMQDIELSSNIKAVDPPYYPLSPIPTKRKILVIIAALFGFLVVFGSILAAEYFDDTLKNPARATHKLNMKTLGVMPKILRKPGTANFPFITSRLLEIIAQNIEMSLKNNPTGKSPRTLLFFSTQDQEGKSVIAANLAHKLKQQGKKVLFLDYRHKEMDGDNASDLHILENEHPLDKHNVKRHSALSSFFVRLMGYSDNRIDYDNPILENPAHLLQPGEYAQFRMDEKFYSVKNIDELMENNGIRPAFVPDFIFLELPSILYYPYPFDLISGIDLPVMVCRSNRTWSEADQSALEALNNVNGKSVKFILNGVDLAAVESVIGEIPKHRSRLRSSVKNLFRFQFHARNQL